MKEPTIQVSNGFLMRFGLLCFARKAHFPAMLHTFIVFVLGKYCQEILVDWNMPSLNKIASFCRIWKLFT